MAGSDGCGLVTEVGAHSGEGVLAVSKSREPRAESREPRAESREPRAESREPRAESREPRAESREPRAESREPRAESREPRAESREPRAESREPRAESREPRAESREPRAESREPRAESREPRAESREPRAESREPLSSCPPGRVMPRLSRCRSGRPPSSLPAAPSGAQSDPLPTDPPGAAPPSRRREPASADRHPHRRRRGRILSACTRRVPAWALLAMIALVAVFALPGGIAQADTLVSNAGQVSSSSRANVTSTQSQAQAFTTGSGGGYELEAVDLRVGTFSGTTSDISVSIYSEDSGDPDSEVHALSNPATIAGGTRTFTAPAGATLDASTTYFVVVSSTGSVTFQLRVTVVDNEDTGGATGWSIADSRSFGSGTSWSTTYQCAHDPRQRHGQHHAGAG